MRIALLVFDGVFDTGLSALLDTLTVANQLAAPRTARQAPFVVSRLGTRRRVRTGQGLRLDLASASEVRRPDMVILPGLGPTDAEALATLLRRPDIVRALPLLREWRARGTCLAAACTATFVLAEAGLLEGLAATTSWWLSATLRERYPGVKVDESRMVIEQDEGRIATAGAALAHVDLALWAVRQSSPSLAQKTAHFLLCDERPSQAAFILPDHIAHSDELVERFERYAREHLRGFSMPEAARAVGSTERTLERKLRGVLGKSPMSFVRDLRVEQAVHLLATSGSGLDEIAARVGYADGATLRALLREKTGRGVKELRAG